MRRNAFKVAGLVALAALSLIYLVRPGIAADKNEPPAVIDAKGEVKNLFTGCYGQVGAGGIFASGNDTIKGFVVGAGCDWQVSALVMGVNVKYGFFEDDARALTLGGRVGYTLNAHTLFYGHAGFLMDGKSPNFKESAIMGGVGLETYVNRNVTLFLEAATDLGKWGDFKQLPSVYEINGGIRIRF